MANSSMFFADGAIIRFFADGAIIRFFADGVIIRFFADARLGGTEEMDYCPSFEFYSYSDGTYESIKHHNRRHGILGRPVMI